MKIVVCAKQVPDTTEVKLDPKTNTLIRDGVPSIINPDDKAGIEAALQLKEKCPGSTAIFSALDEINGHKITSIFNKRDVPEYAFYDYRDCPFCKQGRKLEALVNSYGYTSL